ncbi:hypothetical protein TYRP_016307 [Tyrophagus putrescentiae]|nr:hypothetical protein TYRP_016307 [Tyrophagus putrescentiae]
MKGSYSRRSDCTTRAIGSSRQKVATEAGPRPRPPSSPKWTTAKTSSTRLLYSSRAIKRQPAWPHWKTPCSWANAWCSMKTSRSARQRSSSSSLLWKSTGKAIRRGHCSQCNVCTVPRCALPKCSSICSLEEEKKRGEQKKEG